MDETVVIKITASGIGAALAYFISTFFMLPWPAFVAGFIGVFIGEIIADKTTFKKAVITVGATSIMAAFIGSLLISRFNSYPPTGILALIGFLLAFKRDIILSHITSLITVCFTSIKLALSSLFGGSKE